MLYDPKWDAFNLRRLIAWLEKQPPQKRYGYTNTSRCLLAQYFTAIGVKFEAVGTDCVWLKAGEYFAIDLPPHFNEIAMGRGRTFGAALMRARACEVLARAHR
jgi:hypothetical protein